MPRWLDAAGVAKGSAEACSEPGRPASVAKYQVARTRARRAVWRQPGGTAQGAAAPGPRPHRAVAAQPRGHRGGADGAGHAADLRGTAADLATLRQQLQREREQDALRATTDPAIESASTGATAATATTTALLADRGAARGTRACRLRARRAPAHRRLHCPQRCRRRGAADGRTPARPAAALGAGRPAQPDLAQMLGAWPEPRGPR